MLLKRRDECHSAGHQHGVIRSFDLRSGIINGVSALVCETYISCSYTVRLLALGPLWPPALVILAHAVGTGLYRFHYVMVAGTAADVACHSRISFARIRIVLYQIQCTHNHTGRRSRIAVHGFRLTSCIGQGVTVCEAFDRCDVGTLALCGQDCAAFDGLSVLVNNTSATLAGIATNMSTGKAQVLPQELNQQRTRLYLATYRLAVHRHGNGVCH